MSQHEVVRQCGICHSLSQPIYRMREFRDGSPTGRYCEVCHSCLHSGQTLTYQHDQQSDDVQELSSPHTASHPHAATTPVADEHVRQQLADSRHEVFHALTSVGTGAQSVTPETTDKTGGTSSDPHTHHLPEHFSSPASLSRPAVVSRASVKARHRHPDA